MAGGIDVLPRGIKEHDKGYRLAARKEETNTIDYQSTNQQKTTYLFLQ